MAYVLATLTKAKKLLVLNKGVWTFVIMLILKMEKLRNYRAK